LVSSRWHAAEVLTELADRSSTAVVTTGSIAMMQRPGKARRWAAITS
jgi:hypothetical protein